VPYNKAHASSVVDALHCVVVCTHHWVVVVLLLFAKVLYKLYISPCFTTSLQSTDVFSDVAGVSIFVCEEPTAALPLQLTAAAAATVLPAAVAVVTAVTAVVLLTDGSRKLSPL
jgi:hypothetical protein